MRGARKALEAQQAIQDLIAHDAPLEGTLARICQLIEQQASGALCTIMLCEAETQTLRLAAGNLPSTYRQSMQAITISPEAGSCGRAAYWQKLVVTEDIQQDEYWKDYQTLASQHGLRACWSYPVLSKEQRLLGTFAIYHPLPGSPSRRVLEQMHRAVGLVALAVERHQDRRAMRENEQRYRSLFTHHPDGVFSLDLEGAFTSTNPAASRIIGYSEDEIRGQHYAGFVIEQDLPRVDEAFSLACQGTPQHYEAGVIDAKGDLRYLALTSLPIVLDEEVVGVYGIARDITQQKASETQLRLLQRAVESSTNGVIIVDALQPDMPVVYANAPFLTMTGYPLNEVLGQNCRFLLGPDSDPQAISLIRDRLTDQRDVHVTLLTYRKDGAAFWNELFISPVPDDTGRITHFVGLHHDVTEQKANEARVAYNATHDPLTGVANRALLEHRLEHDYYLTQRHQGQLEVIFVDLDDFKSVNDSLGHAAGDSLLIEAAQRLQCLLTPGDTLARFGGDEFVLLLPSMGSEGPGNSIAEQVRQRLAQPYQLGEHEVTISASVGIACSKADLDRPLDLVQHADLAMYQAKMQGRDAVHSFSPHIKDSVNERIKLRKDLTLASQNGELELHYQPLVHARSGTIEGFEALVRWNHPTMGYIPPPRFTALAEQTGQILALGEWIMRQACCDIKAINEELGTQYRVAVNVSPVQFHRQNFLAHLRHTLEETGLPACWLDIELTEGVLMEKTEAAIATLQALRSLGIGTAIDDFGTGFSSLRYLRDLPISKVKLDRSFIQDFPDSSRNAAIVQGVITMAHSLGLKVVAEGVETETQREDLQARKCDLLQGYLFARPMPLIALRQYLYDGTARDLVKAEHSL